MGYPKQSSVQGRCRFDHHGIHDFIVHIGTTMTKITVQAAAAIRADILQTFALRNSASLRFINESYPGV